jgi:hypothetical protein
MIVKGLLQENATALFVFGPCSFKAGQWCVAKKF